jgi:hypothetical protein
MRSCRVRPFRAAAASGFALIGQRSTGPEIAVGRKSSTPTATMDGTAVRVFRASKMKSPSKFSSKSASDHK